MNSMREALNEFLTSRRGAGLRLRAAGYALEKFVSFMEKRGAGYITTALAVEWARRVRSPKALDLARAQHLSFVREFARHRVKTDARTEIPPYGLLSYPKIRAQSRGGVKTTKTHPALLPDYNPAEPLRQAVIQYLSLRRALGHKLKEAGKCLTEFVSFAAQRGADHVTVPLAFQWAQMSSKASPARWAKRLGYVRDFARYRVADDPRTEIPAWDLLPHAYGRTQPYLYSKDEIRQLLQAALNLPISNHHGILRRQTYYCMFGLLAATGLRIGEAVKLTVQDVDLDAGILTIRGSKFGQSRFLPVHPSTREALLAYKGFRDSYLKEHDFDSEFFFTTFRGGTLDPNNVRAKFYVMCHMAGLRAVGARKGPRIHDLRHTYAVESLLRWYREGQDVERKIPLLSTYLGHVRMKNTYWYLTACPELMGLAVKLAEKRWEE
jgi:integrase/recombinase XerD